MDMKGGNGENMTFRLKKIWGWVGKKYLSIDCGPMQMRKRI